jgi:hypothetical protein
LSVARLIERIAIDSGGFASRYLPIIVVSIICTGIYHCLENKAFLHQVFWQVIYWILIVVNIMSVGSIVIVSLYQLNHLWVDALLLIGISFLLFPALIKIRQYANLTRIWQPATRTQTEQL